MRLVSMLTLLLICALTTGCASPDTKNILQTLEFDENECGKFQGQIIVAPPASGTSISATLEKYKSCEGITDKE